MVELVKLVDDAPTHTIVPQDRIAESDHERVAGCGDAQAIGLERG